jgi:hypothetical protein
LSNIFCGDSLQNKAEHAHEKITERTRVRLRFVKDRFSTNFYAPIFGGKI